MKPHKPFTRFAKWIARRPADRPAPADCARRAAVGAFRPGVRLQRHMAKLIINTGTTIVTFLMAL